MKDVSRKFVVGATAIVLMTVSSLSLAKPKSIVTQIKERDVALQIICSDLDRSMYESLGDFISSYEQAVQEGSRLKANNHQLYPLAKEFRGLLSEVYPFMENHKSTISSLSEMDEQQQRDYLKDMKSMYQKCERGTHLNNTIQNLKNS